MIRTVYIEGVKATVQKFNFKVFSIVSLMIVTLILSGCNNTTTSNSTDPGKTDLNETAATVNGKVIKLEEVERGLKQQAQGQESKMSPLELAAARLQVLESLIQQEVMYQKAEKEGTVPTDEEVTAELNKLKTGSGQSAEQFEKKLQETGATEQTLKDSLKKQLAFNKLIDKITGKIESPKDSEIEAFYNSNKEGFKNKRGAQLAAIVIDPQKTSDSDTTDDRHRSPAKSQRSRRKSDARCGFCHRRPRSQRRPANQNAGRRLALFHRRRNETGIRTGFIRLCDDEDEKRRCRSAGDSVSRENSHPETATKTGNRRRPNSGNTGRS